MPDAKWRRYCRKNKDKTSPNPDLFAEIVIHSNRVNRQAVKEEIKEIKPKFYQKVIVLFWSIFYPHKFTHLNKLWQGQVSWSKAYQSAWDLKKPISNGQ